MGLLCFQVSLFILFFRVCFIPRFWESIEKKKMKHTFVFFVFLYISYGILDGTPACPGICTGNSACPSGKYFSLFKISLGNFLKLKMPMYISKVSYALKEAYHRVCLDAQKELMLTNHMELLSMRT